MRVGLTGAHGTGKTTIARRLTKYPELMHMSLVPSASREALSNGYKLNQQAGRLDQLVMLNAHIGRELNMNGTGYITDRTPLDFMAYAYWHWKHEGWDDFYMMVTESLIAGTMNRYDAVFYTPAANLKFIRDGVRAPQPEYRDEIDRIILMLLTDMQIPYIEVPEGTADERAEFVRSCLYKVRYS